MENYSINREVDFFAGLSIVFIFLFYLKQTLKRFIMLNLGLLSSVCLVGKFRSKNTGLPLAETTRAKKGSQSAKAAISKAKSNKSAARSLSSARSRSANRTISRLS